MGRWREEEAIVLLSGGLDSATALGWAIKEGFRPTALTFLYGQKHGIEVRFAEKIASHFQVPHLLFTLPEGLFLRSALTDRSLPVPESPTEGIPLTYVPARNLVFLSLAVAIAEGRGIHHIVIGANAVDFSGYPDCREEFFSAFQKTATIGTKIGLEKGFYIHAPLIHLPKDKIIELGFQLGVPYEWTTSCYQPSEEGIPCGVCDSCRIRREGFSRLKKEDPLLIRLKGGNP
jgi:7-cyano-7-deazaguanine synthase